MRPGREKTTIAIAIMSTTATNQTTVNKSRTTVSPKVTLDHPGSNYLPNILCH
jgi:hypothetical protein